MSCTVAAPHQHVIQWTQAFGQKSARDGIVPTRDNPPTHFAPTYSLASKDNVLTLSHSSINLETASHSGVFCPRNGRVFSRYAGHASPDVPVAIDARPPDEQQTLREIAATLMEQARSRAGNGSHSMKKLIESVEAEKKRDDVAMKLSQNDPDRTPLATQDGNMFEKFIDLTMVD